MKLFRAIRDGFAAAARAGAPADCFGCRHFENGAAFLEAALPGLATFSSARASVRADDGLCLRHGHYVNGRRACADFAACGKAVPACPAQ
ncbi:MAG: hypothetical protein ACLQIQ_16855 [Beijerinckiaceae bacterium]